jgi:hypothetical protein
MYVCMYACMHARVSSGHMRLCYLWGGLTLESPLAMKLGPYVMYVCMHARVCAYLGHVFFSLYEGMSLESPLVSSSSPNECMYVWTWARVSWAKGCLWRVEPLMYACICVCMLTMTMCFLHQGMALESLV